MTAPSTSLLPMIASHGLTSAFPSERQTTVASITKMASATYSQYQKSSEKFSSTVISFSSVKPSSSSVSSQWPTTSVTSTSRIISSSTIMSQSRLGTSSLTAPSTSLLPMISSHGLTSAFPSKRQTTVASTSQLPPTLAPSECRPGDCENNGTCIVPGYYCRCLKYYVWHRCSVYVGKCVSNDQERINRQTGKRLV